MSNNETQKPVIVSAPVVAQDNAVTAPSACTMSAEDKDVSKLNAEIKKTWDKLSDEEVALYAAQPEQFFAALLAKHEVSQEDAQKVLTDIQAACGTCSVEKAA